jgi:hypothetical protein
MSHTPSLRHLWTMCEKLLASEEDIDRRDRVLAQSAFYTGARGILKVQSYLLERGRYDELHAMIENHGRQIET